jgi:predicted Holliday junction resolvase-like endonuclease
MDLISLENPRDLIHVFLGIVGGTGLTWICLNILYRFRERGVRREAADLALSRSRRVLKGQAAEQLAPLSSDFPFLPSDARFLGSPIDYVVFDGLSDEEEVEVVFVEVKSGGARLSPREKRLKEAVEAGRVRWMEFRV